MELREFAERILFATTLEEKLQCPVNITDEWAGLPLVTPTMPGGPPELRFKPPGARKADFPGVHCLEHESARGRLLHFFANHELLATELMALVLLRFPDAPPAFRRGVLQTLEDEQEHTRLYLRRMRECGVQFGQLPVSGYFWRAISGMESPMDYVAGLSLTFEQANLDFARQFQREFAAVGDGETARLLDRVYHDEIGHVAYGLKWFRRWKNPQESVWEAFCRQLRFPLSPQRAKGPTLNVEGRHAAGLEPAFIDELSVYSQSKGRTPNVFVFNPFAEGRIAQGKSFTPVKHQKQLARDLANLPQFLCRQDDVVLVEQRPSVRFLSGLKQAGFALPEFVELKEGRIPSESSLRRRKLGSLRPWAWAPDSVELFEPLFGKLSQPGEPGQYFNEDIARLYSKSWSAEFLLKVLKRLRGSGELSFQGESAKPFSPPLSGLTHPLGASGTAHDQSGSLTVGWVCTDREVGVTARTFEEVLAAIAAIRGSGHHKVVIKEEIGLAGHNSLRLWEPELLEKQRRWLGHNLEHGRRLVVEPWLERELDFSVQFEMGEPGLKLCGYTGLLNDRKGQYQANWAAPNFARRMPTEAVALLGGPTDIADRVQHLYTEIAALLEPQLRAAGYRGPLGIDAFVYRTLAGARRLKPIVEINPRYTMGRVTVELMRRACPGSFGLLRLVSRAMARREGIDGFSAYWGWLRERFPLRLDGHPVPKILSGALCLNDPVRAQACLAVFQVGRGLEELWPGIERHSN
jgi:uncharacterized ferritin-like protein (DUF455 family)